MNEFATHDFRILYMAVLRRVRSLLFTFACLAILAVNSASSGFALETTGPESGTLVLVGGGDRNHIVFKQFVDLAGGRDAKIVFVTTASSSDPDHDYRRDRSATFARQELRMTNVTLVHTHDRAEADTEKFVRPIREADAVWFSGG